MFYFTRQIKSLKANEAFKKSIKSIFFVLAVFFWGLEMKAADEKPPATSTPPANSGWYPPERDLLKDDNAIKQIQDQCMKEKDTKAINLCWARYRKAIGDVGNSSCQSAKQRYSRAVSEFNKQCSKANMTVGKTSPDDVDEDEDSPLGDTSMKSSACYAEVQRCKKADGSYGQALGNFSNTTDGNGAITGLLQGLLGGKNSSKYCPTKLGKDVAEERKDAQKQLKEIQDSISESNKTLDEAKKAYADKKSETDKDLNLKKSEIEMMAVKSPAEQFDIYRKGQQQIQAASLRIRSLNTRIVEQKNIIESKEAEKIANLQTLMLGCDLEIEQEKTKYDSSTAVKKGQGFQDLNLLKKRRQKYLEDKYNSCKKRVSIQWKKIFAETEAAQQKAKSEIASLEAEITTMEDEINQLRNAVKLQLETKEKMDNLEYKSRLQAMNDSLNAVNTEAQLLEGMQNRIDGENRMKNMQLMMSGMGFMSGPMNSGIPSNTSTIYDVAAEAENRDVAYADMYQACCIESLDLVSSKLCSKETADRMEKLFGEEGSKTK